MASNDDTHRNRSTSRDASVGGSGTCDHPLDDRTYLGHMGTAAFYQCTLCRGVVIAW